MRIIEPKKKKKVSHNEIFMKLLQIEKWKFLKTNKFCIKKEEKFVGYADWNFD